MKPIIVDMKDITDSVEVYESRVNPVLVYVIYVLALLLVAAFGWMYFSRIDIVVKSNGMFRSNEDNIDVSVAISGEVYDCNIEEGQYVEKGDILFAIDVESLEETIKNYKELSVDVLERIEMLKAYDNYLSGDTNALEMHMSNRYYDEIVSRKELLELTIQNTDTEFSTQKEQYQSEVKSLKVQIDEYKSQISKLHKAEECVKNRNNSFDISESYYESIISSYITNYNITASQYDRQIDEYEKTKDDLEEQLKILPEEENIMTVENINHQIADIEDAIINLADEKKSALKNLELQQIAALEKQIDAVNSTLISVEKSLSSVQSQINILDNSERKITSEVSILTEKQNVATELTNYYAKKTDYDNALKQYILECRNGNIVAENSGYIYMMQEIKEGSYVTQGTTVCQILPESTGRYYAEIYVENSDIAKIEEGQDVKLEISAYPSSEYGYFTGVIESVSKDIKVDQLSGSAYYLVKVKCNQTTVVNNEGKTGNIMNGMACQAKIIVDEENVLSYLLKKMDFVD